MRQILQNFKEGKTELVEVPCPVIKAGHLLIQTTASLISAGTERMLVDFGKAAYLEKARQQPDKVKQVLDRVRTDGLLPTIEAVRNKLDKPIPLGYSNVGVVVENQKVRRSEDQRISSETQQSVSPSNLLNISPSAFSIGDRGVSNGPHAEVVCVPKNLCAKVPDRVSDEEAAFTVVGAIGLQGVRLGSPC